MKRCWVCKTQKPVSEFHKNASKKCGLASECRGCTAVRQSKERKEDSERLRENRSRNYQKNKVKILAQQRLRYRPNKANARKGALKYLYGITPRDVDVMARFQSGACAICGRVRKLVIDHDHKTGKVRELLCYSCNSALGKFGDCQRMLLAAIRYLKFHDGLREG